MRVLLVIAVLLLAACQSSAPAEAEPDLYRCDDDHEVRLLQQGNQITLMHRAQSYQLKAQDARTYEGDRLQWRYKDNTVQLAKMSMLQSGRPAATIRICRRAA